MGCDPELTLCLIGPLRLLRRDGTDVTPRATKAQGLLALLGTSPTLRRSRAWLKDKLWSDRQQEQGSASLRQALSALRQAVGADAQWLRTEGDWLALDPARVAIVLQPAEWEAGGEPPEFCEGLDIADPEFEDWIRNQRLAWADKLTRPAAPAAGARANPSRPPETTAPTLLVAAGQAGDDATRTLADIVGTEVALRVARLGGANIVLEGPGVVTPVGADAVRLQMKACRLGDRAMLQAQLCDAERGTLLWSNGRIVPVASVRMNGASAVEALVAEITAAVAYELGRGGPGEAGPRVRASYRALRSVLAFDGLALSECDRTLALACESRATAVLQAWRAHIRVISVVERFASDPTETGLEAQELALRALEGDPLNPIVNAIAADVSLHVECRPLKAVELAQAAVQRDPVSPFAHASLAQALARQGQVRRAHVQALRALRLSIGQPNRSWWYMRCCVTAVRCGRFEEAARFAQTAHELSPTFHAPIRFLAALRFHLRDEAGALEALRGLKLLEPDFSLELMASEEYPLASLRGTPLMDVSRSRLI